MRDEVEHHSPSPPPVQPPGRSIGRSGVRSGGWWVYLLPAVLLLGAGWTYRDGRQTSVFGSSDREVLDANGFPLESATDPEDPRRFRRVDGFVEDAATGIRLPDQDGLSPAEVFEQAGLGVAAPFGFDDGVGVDGVADRKTTLPQSSTPVQQFLALRALGPPADLRYGIGPRPANLTVAAIGVKSGVVPIGLDSNRALQVPRRADIVGWWSGGSAPGEDGPTVLVGHFDSRIAGGVFARLKDVTIGELIDVTQSDGARYVYFVTEVEHLSKTAFPTSKVYGRTASSTLRLVTCGGKFDRKTGHYVENTIVYADLWSLTPSVWTNTTRPPASDDVTTTSFTSAPTTVPGSQPVGISSGLSSTSTLLPRVVTSTSRSSGSPAASRPGTAMPTSGLPTTVSPSTTPPTSTPSPTTAVSSTGLPPLPPAVSLEPAIVTTSLLGDSVTTQPPSSVAQPPSGP